jgi:adenylate cyclase
MADIRNFTELSESMPPDQLITLLNEYFVEMVAAVNEHGGLVDKFIGDAIMAVFGIPDTHEAERRAYETAAAMRTRLTTLNERLAQRGMPTLDNGIGIHSGEVTAGYLGSEERLEFTVIGAPVNLAARIEQETKQLGKAVLFSQSFAEKLPEYFKATFVIETSLKGISRPVRLYTMDI